MDLFAVAFQLIGGFQVKGQIFEGGMVDDADHGVQADAAFPDPGMAVLVGAERVLRWTAFSRLRPMTVSKWFSTWSR